MNINENDYILNVIIFCLCAGHGMYLGGESPLWGQSRNCQPLAEHQGCPS